MGMYNSAEVNADLWKVKAYVSIQPIRLPDGLPTQENMKNFRLLSNGKVIDKTKRYPKHMQDIPREEMRPVKSLNLAPNRHNNYESADNEALRTGVATKLSRGKYGGNPLRHENLWNFEGDVRPTRR